MKHCDTANQKDSAMQSQLDEYPMGTDELARAQDLFLAELGTVDLDEALLRTRLGLPLSWIQRQKFLLSEHPAPALGVGASTAATQAPF